MSQIKTKGDAMVTALSGIVSDSQFGLHIIDRVEALTEHAIRVIPTGLDWSKVTKCQDLKVSLNVYLYTPLMHKTAEDHFLKLEDIIPAVQGTGPKEILTSNFMDWNAVISGKTAITIIQATY